ncbi:MAG: hypothetical protein ACSHX6_02360 [Akkermansiaceae bacterium]
MKNLIWLPCLFLVSACGEEKSATGETLTESEPAVVEVMPAPEEATPVARDAGLPWDIPTIPNARVIHSSSTFSKTTVRRGGESTALIAFKGSAAEIVDFYEQALPELGFEITHSRDLDEKSSRLNATHADGRQFQVFANRGGSKAKDGESSASLVATKAKLEE